MKGSKKAAIAATCLFLIVLIGGSIYVYERIGHILSASSLEQLLASSNQDKLAAFNSPKAPETNDNPIPQDTVEQETTSEVPNIVENYIQQATVEQNKEAQGTTPQSKSSPQSADSELNNKIASSLEKEVGRSIDTSDMLKAGYILMNKLNNNEINFLMGFSDKKYTSKELKELRKLLLSKLSAEDVATLRALADKYGRNLYILDPNVPIK